MNNILGLVLLSSINSICSNVNNNQKYFTSTVASTSRSLKGDSSAHAVVAAAASRPVVGARSLHAHGLTLGFIMCAHFRPAALEDLYIPKDINAE